VHARNYIRKENNTVQYDKIYMIYVYGCYMDSIFQKHGFMFEISMPFLRKEIPFVCFYSSLTMALIEPKHIYVL
jgi:hypothetical protein